MKVKCLALIFLSGVCIVNSQSNNIFLINSSELRGGGCCCGQFNEIFFPNLDFEAGPSPAPNTFIVYSVGQNFGGWTVTRATVDHCDAGVGNLGAGNPNGASYFVDLHGSPGLGAISYDLFGLTAGNQYRIDFWTAQNGSGFSSDGNLKIGNGVWLNATWTVSVSGAVSWRKESFMFTALSSSTTMEFSSTGPMVFQGTLIDDIHIFECPGDVEDPVVNNPQDDLEVECEKEVPKVPNLNVSDNCDPNPVITFKEIKETIDPCSKRFTRKWEIKDICGNVTLEEQIIDIIDKNPPEFTKLPENKIVYCDKDVIKEFNDWLKKNGNATAIDLCGPVSWRSSYDRNPYKYCDTILTEFIAVDHCGKESSEYASFIVRDTVAPKFIIQAQSKNLICVPNTRDSLRNWLKNYGFSKTGSDCDTILFKSDFDGDSTKNPIIVKFYALDRCGNIDSTQASFSYRSNSDTFRITDYSCLFPKNSMDTTVFNINGCDSIVIHQKIKQLADTTLISLNTCDPKQKLLDSIKLLNVNGCDSLVILMFQLQKTPQTTIQMFDCKYQNMFKDTMMFAGQFCDSFVITEHIPLRKDSIFIQNTSCDSSLLGKSIKMLINQIGCDSIVITDTKFSGQQITQIVKKECGLKTNYVDTVIYSSSNCDSLVITQHTGLKTDSTFLQGTTCEVSKAGIFIKLLTNQSGCDSVIIENIGLLSSDSVQIAESTCVYSQAGIVFQKLVNSNGCDSIVKIIKTFVPSDTIRDIQWSCNYLDVGIDTIIYSTKQCDSMVITDTRFIPADTTFSTQYTCNALVAGKDTLVFNTSTCDSIVFVTSIYIPSDRIIRSDTSCSLSLVGLDSIKLHNRWGCDSVIVTNTVYQPLQLSYEIDSIRCFGQNNGIFKLLNLADFKSPFEIYINNLKIPGQEQINNLMPGNYEVFIKDSLGCYTDSVHFALINPEPLVTDLGDHQEVKKGTIVKLILSSNKPLMSILWQPPNWSGCVNCNQIEVEINQDTWIYSLAIDERNCTSLDSIFIQVKKQTKVYAPNVFSPNGDQINDYFYIAGDPDAEVELLVIFDRWGEKIFEARNIPVNVPGAGWNGYFKSLKMNPAVFIYFAKIKTKEQDVIELKGDISLIK